MNKGMAPEELIVSFGEQREMLLRDTFPGRNEKYYQILMLAGQRLCSTNFRVNTTADAVIKECQSARPTWYSYFKNIEDYYEDVICAWGDLIVAHSSDLQNSMNDLPSFIDLKRHLRSEMVLANMKMIVGFFPALKNHWLDAYDHYLENQSEVVASITGLSTKRADLFCRNIVNELVLQPEKYFEEADHLEKLVMRQYMLLLAEQNG